MTDFETRKAEYDKKTDAEKNEEFFREARHELGRAIRNISWKVIAGLVYSLGWPFISVPLTPPLPLWLIGIPFFALAAWDSREVYYCADRLIFLHKNPPYPIRPHSLEEVESPTTDIDESRMVGSGA